MLGQFSVVVSKPRNVRDRGHWSLWLSAKQYASANERFGNEQIPRLAAEAAQVEAEDKHLDADEAVRDCEKSRRKDACKAAHLDKKLEEI